MSIKLPPRPSLRLSSYSVIGLHSYLYYWAVRRPDGTVQTGGQQVDWEGVFGTYEFVDVPVADGELIWAGVLAVGASRQAGQSYVGISIIYEGQPFPLATIPVCAGWADTVNGPAYPMQPMYTPDDGFSPATMIALIDPAAGVQASTVLAGVEVGELVAVRAVLVTSATAANRFVFVGRAVAAPDEVLVTSPLAQTASTTAAYTFVRNGVDAYTVGTARAIPMPKLGAIPNSTLYVGAQAIQAGDQISNVRAWIRWRPTGL